MMPIKASVLLLTYNQETFVAAALQSLLDQDYEDLEIVISDDCSSDGTWQVIRQLVAEYEGNKKIVTNRNQFNMGVVGNYFKAFAMSNGAVIFTAAGDDVSLPIRCSACIEFWKKKECKPELVAADAFDMLMDGTVLGIKKNDDLERWNLKKWRMKRPYMFGASHMMKRELLALRDLDPGLTVEDQNLVARALMMGGCVRFDTPLVMHRRGGISQSKANISYEVKKNKLVKSAQQSLLEQLELRNDAKLLGIDIGTVSDRNYELSKYILDVFEVEGIQKKINKFLLYRHIPVAKRFRFFQFSAFPKMNALAIKVKNQLKAR